MSGRPPHDARVNTRPDVPSDVPPEVPPGMQHGTRPDYARVARSPRMIGLLLLLLAIAAVCGRLGAWQLDRAQERAAKPASAPAAVALAEVLAPQQGFRGDLVGRVVVVTGSFGDDQLLVPDRDLDGRPGSWAVAPFIEEGTGAVLPVVRGWQPDGATPPAVPDGVVRLEGRLAAGEDATGTEIASVSPAQLVNRWGGPIYSAYLVATSPVPDGLVAVPAPVVAGRWDVQNLAYAAQWWLFGGAAVLLWGRMVRDEAREAAATEQAAAAGQADVTGPAGDTEHADVTGPAGASEGP